MKFQHSKLIIICATQRCGSTMVVEDMRSTGVLGKPEEYFIPWDPTKSDINWINQLETIANKASTDNGVIAVKVMADQLPRIDECLKSTDLQIPEDSKGKLFAHFRELTKNARFIFIRRDNVLRQAISRVMSSQTGINHATENVSDEHFAGNLLRGYKSSYNDSTIYDKHSIEKHMFKIVQENLLWEAFFNEWDISNPLSLRYEEICKNSPTYLNRVSRHASVEIDLGKHARKMVKLSNQKNEKWYNTYIESMAL